MLLPFSFTRDSYSTPILPWMKQCVSHSPGSSFPINDKYTRYPYQTSINHPLSKTNKLAMAMARRGTQQLNNEII